jgi:CheY-like chemotaxis protein
MARVLVVDDSPAIREMLRAALEYADHEVGEASTLDDAVYEIETGRYDVVIADGHFPRAIGSRIEPLGPWLLRRASEFCRVRILHSADHTLGASVRNDGIVVLPKCSSMAKILKAVEC